MSKPNLNPTDPMSLRTLDETTLDALAIAWGPQHGINKGVSGSLRFDLIRDAHAVISNISPVCYLVSHGSSLIPNCLIQEINANGGSVGASGLTAAQIKEAVILGITKLNIGTDLSLAVTATYRSYFNGDPSKYDPRDFTASAKQYVYTVAVDAMRLLGSSNRGWAGIHDL